MTTNIAVNRGSEWRKWDLHFHTPSSYDYKDKSVTNQKIIDILAENKISVVAITDHHTMDIDRIQELQQLGKNKGITVLPGIEFCSELGGSESIHFIGIFSEKSDFSTIWTKIQGKHNLTKADIERKGNERIVCNFVDTCKTIIELGGIISVHAGSKSNSIESIKSNLLVKQETKTTLLSDYVSILELGKPEDEKVYQEKVFPSIGFKLPIIICSDNHDIKNYSLKENCWIKADPTFEGLKQIIYEPTERVKIQENNPKLDYDKPYFSSIFFRNDENIFKDEELYFDKSTQEIPLNPNLVAIIGGRGEGKSMLMKYISTSFAIKTIETDKDFLKSGNIEVKYSKTIKNEEEFLPFPIINNTKHSLDFIYISQGELKNIVEKKEKLAEGISKMADIKEIAFDQNLDKEVSDKLEELHNIVVFLEDSQNNLEKLQEQENTQRQFIENITTKENKEKLEQYTKILGDINIETDKKIQLLKLKNIFSQEEINLNENITSINQKYSLDIPTIQKEQIFKLQLEKIEELLKSIEEHFISLNQEKERIKNEFSQFYTGDLTTLLKDVDKYQSELSLISDKIKRVNEAIEKKRNLIKVIFEDIGYQLSLISKIKAEYNKQEKSILEDWEKFKNIELREDLNSQQKRIMQTLLQDLNIEAVTEFNKEAFYNEIYHCINGAGWRIKNNQKAQEEYFGINDLDSFFNFLKEKYLEASSINGIHRDVLRATLFNEQYRQKYIKIYPILKYKGKNLDKISIGQKGTVYLKMKLATEAFSKPIVFDQPEDDLDNQFIIKELVDLFKELKK
uniref:TrlF family AAA-like ATPase n=1 Tax=Capnocytophaga ochracea TaxID=1018 RepID=UPI00241E15E3